MKKLIVSLVLLILFSPSGYSYSELTCEEKDFLNQTPLIRVGVDRDFPPFSYVDVNDKKIIKGFNIDALKELEKVLRVRFEITPASWSDAVSMLESREIDVIAGMIYSDERCKNYDFSLPLVVSTRAVFKRKTDNTVVNIRSLKGKVVAVQKKDISEEIVKDLFPAEIKKVAAQSDGLRMVSRGDAAAFVGNRLVGAYNIKKYNLHNVVPLRDIINPMDYSLAVLKGNERLIRILNKGIMRIDSSGKLSEIQNRHFGVYAEYKWLYDWLIILIIVFSVILIIVVLFNIALKKQINAKTEELKTLINILTSRNQEIVKMYQRMRHNEYSKNGLLKMFAHDLKSPLVSVKGYIDMMKNGAYGNITSRQSESLGKSLHSIDKLINFINDFLGKKEKEAQVHKSVFNLKELINECADLYGYFIAEKNLKFKFLSEGFLDIYTDKEKVKVIIMNLLDNAFKYCDYKGAITLTAKSIEKSVEIVLINTCTEPEVDPDKWFSAEPDAELDKKCLGLYLIKKLIEQLKGKLSAEHKDGEVIIKIILLDIA